MPARTAAARTASRKVLLLITLTRAPRRVLRYPARDSHGQPRPATWQASLCCRPAGTWCARSEQGCPPVRTAGIRRRGTPARAGWKGSLLSVRIRSGAEWAADPRPATYARHVGGCVFLSQCGGFRKAEHMSPPSAESRTTPATARPSGRPDGSQPPGPSRQPAGRRSPVRVSAPGLPGRPARSATTAATRTPSPGDRSRAGSHDPSHDSNPT